MNGWTVAFCDVCHHAMLYAKERAFIHGSYWSFVSLQRDLGMARVRLECVMAQYRVIRKEKLAAKSGD